MTREELEAIQRQLLGPSRIPNQPSGNTYASPSPPTGSEQIDKLLIALMGEEGTRGARENIGAVSDLLGFSGGYDSGRQIARGVSEGSPLTSAAGAGNLALNAMLPMSATAPGRKVLMEAYKTIPKTIGTTTVTALPGATLQGFDELARLDAANAAEVPVPPIPGSKAATLRQIEVDKRLEEANRSGDRAAKIAAQTEAARIAAEAAERRKDEAKEAEDLQSKPLRELYPAATMAAPIASGVIGGFTGRAIASGTARARERAYNALVEQLTKATRGKSLNSRVQAEELTDELAKLLAKPQGGQGAALGAGASEGAFLSLLPDEIDYYRGVTEDKDISELAKRGLIGALSGAGGANFGYKTRQARSKGRMPDRPDLRAVTNSMLRDQRKRPPKK